ncbi:Component of the septin ring of the mother-bud neck that is required for cytokinesis [Komagataella phaffii GS115]|uniref:Component of the septin ring of the mother-bud neck that is required for cytokinesis n=2 Tax=Komagataella phaffii TaxID=460519 RepID=C4R883_KOMPG|nr:Component of the septin ring of the mother-bud neck that is required for cytokinesis [Komagataella phaffii GS115]AOA64425.1 GQ67_04918T0 [Komagataella phaffii]CAY71808.1 Component of the septin ring of the mother-bud neck that is required for cytokinesis [Komagataella phaffii GS115]
MTMSETSVQAKSEDEVHLPPLEGNGNVHELQDDLESLRIQKSDVQVDPKVSSGIEIEHEDLKIIRRKLTSYVGFASLPKQWHRKSMKRGFNLNLMVVGQSGLGKSTLINTLFNKELYPIENDGLETAEQLEEVSEVTIETASSDIVENGVKLHLTVVDTPGFGDCINNIDAWKPIVEEIENRFNIFLEAETRINRTTIVDNRIHALLYFIEPTGHSLTALDIQFLKRVHEKVNLIPVIAKSDTLTEEEIYGFKQRILEDIRNQHIKIFEPPQYEDLDDEESLQITKEMISKIPFAIVGSTQKVQTADGRTVRGRSYPWGVIEVDNDDHCDFIKLRQLLIRDFMEDLKEHTAKVLYENYRTEKLLKTGITQDDSVFREFDPVRRQKEERALQEAALAKLEADMESVLQKKVADKEKKLQKSEAELIARHKEMKAKFLKKLKTLEEKKKMLENTKTTPHQEPHAQPPAKTRKGFLR